MEGPGPVEPAPPLRALVLSGGVALGAFEAGAYAALEESGAPAPDILVGGSAGAVNAAIIAGNPRGARAAALRRFWDLLATDPTPATTFLLGPPPPSGVWRTAYNEASALQTLLLGHPHMFRPRMAPGPRIGEAPSLFDLEPLLARLPDFIDFDRLNGGEGRLALAATDVETGERVVFDTAAGARIGPRHVVASCALLPVFAPVEVEGRLLADAGLASNAPLDLVLDAPRDRALDCILIELFARAGSRPRTLGAAVARAADLGFGNQTQRILEGRAREQRLRALVGRLAARLPPALRADAEVAALLAEARPEPPLTLVRIGYRGAHDEAGPGKLFDYSAATLTDRWAAGEAAMRQALQRLRAPAMATPLAEGLLLHEVEATPAAR
jgi:NTE family protein